MRRLALVALILHSDERSWADSVREAVLSQARALFGEPEVVQCVEELPAGDGDSIVALYLATHAGLDDEALQEDVRAAAERGVVVVPVVRPEDGFDNVVPTLLSPVNAIPWSDSAHDVVLHVLAALGLTDSERAVFISYRRQDAAHIAEALWERLSQRRFDVFLDRFSVDPGEDFQQRIRNELCDKAFVVVIESPAAAGARWVEYEVGYAQTHNIGMRAITLPATKRDQQLGVVAESFRLRLDDDEVQPVGQRGWELTEPAVERIVRELELAHQDLLVRRHAEIDDGVCAALSRAGREVTRLSNRFLLATGTASELLRVTARAPRPHDLWRLDSERERLTQCGRLERESSARLVHAAADVDPDALGLADWIGGGHRLETTLLAHFCHVLEPAS